MQQAARLLHTSGVCAASCPTPQAARLNKEDRLMPSGAILHPKNLLDSQIGLDLLDHIPDERRHS
jgi:hypothetical protein